MTYDMRKTMLFALLSLVAFSAFAQSRQVRVFSHRGGRMEFDENTLSAFEASYKAGYRGYETDVRMTADGVLVILHDSSLERTSDGKGRVEEMTAEQIRKVNTKGGHKVLFLDDLMDWLDSKGDIEYVEFELKSNPAELYPEERLREYVDKLYERVMRNKPEKASYLFTSSDYRGLRYIQVKHPEADILLITSRPCDEETVWFCNKLGIKRVGATMSGTSRKDVEYAHKKGLIVSLWPGHSVEDFMYGVYVGADYLCTDVPVQVKDFVKHKAKWLDNIEF